MITKLELKNFTTFDDLAIDFSPRINVIIGENSTGKTHLLKAAYGLCSVGAVVQEEDDKEKKEATLTTKFVRLFLPLDDKLGNLHHNGARQRARIESHFALDRHLVVTFHNNSKSVAIQEYNNYHQYAGAPVFIPTKEVLSFMKGFTSLYERYELSFDQTYQDICLLLDLPEIRLESLQEKANWAMKEIEAICRGRFVFYGGGKVTFKTDYAEYSANAMAEGFRKAGMLSRLLATGAIQPGISGPLFWDEPESNLNPKVMQKLVEILLELSRKQQQVIIATHDYVILKWFDLLSDAGKEDQVYYHSLYEDTSGRIRIHTTDDYLEIEPNPIDDTFEALINSDIDRSMGG